ncbi:hypothetical protein PMIN03_000540 [Paraphaeosphaeria minitans]|uniref:C-3 sterol dehydrogenase c-4 decarboxylase n=1 Tax=Paraphaeosphaeria minitans TaxID=565426 RepID=A0A9P6GT84_9PLEO|nr:c-3 sterol dehydrogenase c-4 decarboxylase [Paraphaeosphaeria minitans]
MRQTNRIDRINDMAGDLSQKNAASAVFKRTNRDVLINVASPNSMTSKKPVREVQYSGRGKYHRLAQEQGICMLVYSSNSEFIQDSFRDMISATKEWPVQENPVNGSIYAKIKALGEGLVLAASRQRGLLRTAIRRCTLLGEGDMVLTRNSCKPHLPILPSP